MLPPALASAPARTAPPRHDGTRADIQGLRAFAVVAVIANHVFRQPQGGFVGVDIFFVISGFLITSLLLREYAATGRISLRGFYLRRVKRLLPAALLVLVVTFAAAHLIFYTDRAASVSTDIGWAALFLANWRFLSQQTDYFQAESQVSPVQHFWSLGVEEQFYLAWPLILIVTLASSRVLPARVRMGVCSVVVAGILVGGFVHALEATASNTSQAYFSTVARAWEFAAGALIALTVAWWQRLPALLGQAVFVGGLAGCVASVWVVREGPLFPAPMAALPVVAAMAVIIGGAHVGSKAWLGWPLTNRVSRYVGDISYSLYLWHFPILVFAEAYFGRGGALLSAGVLVGTLMVSALSFHMLEDPLRRSPLLDRKGSRQRQRDLVRAWAGDWRRRWEGVALTGVTSVVALATVAAMEVPRPPGGSPGDVAVYGRVLGATETSQRGVAAPASQAEQQLAADISEALAAEQWPDLEPGFDDLSALAERPEDQQCVSLEGEVAEACVFGDASQPAVVVLGDSTGLSLLPSVLAALGEDFRIVGLTSPGCTFSIEPAYTDQDRVEDCPTFLAAALARIADLEPVLVMVSQTYDAVLRPRSGATGALALREWQTGSLDLVRRLAELSRRVLLVEPPPVSTEFPECASRRSVPADCAYSVQDFHRDVFASESAVARSVSGVRQMSTRAWFCTADGRCPAFVGGMLVKRDFVHTTPAWAVAVAPFLGATLRPWLREARRQA